MARKKAITKFACAAPGTETVFKIATFDWRNTFSWY